LQAEGESRKRGKKFIWVPAALSKVARGWKIGEACSLSGKRKKGGGFTTYSVNFPRKPGRKPARLPPREGTEGSFACPSTVADRGGRRKSNISG